MKKRKEKKRLSAYLLQFRRSLITMLRGAAIGII